MPKILTLLAFSLVFASVAQPVSAQTSCPTTPASSNSATFTVVVPQDSTYTFWGRMITPDAQNNSFFIQIDGNCAMIVGDSAAIPANQFTWVNYQNGDQANPITTSLTAGTHTITLTEREGGVGVDTLFFTDTPCIPTGLGTNCQGYVTATPAPPTNTPIPSPTPLACTTSSTAWKNTSIAQQTRTFTTTFTATPNNANMDGVLGLSNGAADAYTDLAASVRFNNTGFIDVRNAGSYQAATSYAYTPGTAYTFRMEVNIATRRYSVYVKQGAAAETLLANNFAFRTEQASVTQLNNFAVISSIGTMNQCSLAVVQPTPTPTPTPAPPTATPLPTNTPTPTPPTQTYTLNPIADSYVNASATGTNYGTTTIMNVDSSPVNIGYLKFDLTPLAGKTIVSATFRIRTGTDNSTNQQRIKPVSNTSWTETGIKYNNRPSLGSTTLGTINSNGATNAWQQVNLTSTVASNVGRVFSLGIDSSGSNNIWLWSRESTSKPELVIQAR